MMICEEIFDESSHPSVEEINEYAEKIGIDPTSEPHLLHLAKEGLMQALPSEWKPCFDEKSKSYYYYNSQSTRTQWEHPLDGIYRSLVNKVRSNSSQASFDEDSKGHEDQTYTKEDLNSFEEILPKPFTLPKKLDPIPIPVPINLGGARKKDSTVLLSPIKSRPKSSNTNININRRLITTSRSFSADNVESESNSKHFLSKNDKHPNMIEKRELTLSGSGSMFLKSNTRKTMSINSSETIDSEYFPKKSILRDQQTSKEPPLGDVRRIDSEDDRKSVRFNLEMVSEDVKFIFSESEDGDGDGGEDEIEDIIKNKSESLEVSIVKNGRFTVSPVLIDDDYNQRKFEEKLEENASPKTNLKLIKPNPTDFITPEPFDSVKFVTLLSDPENEIRTKFKTKSLRDVIPEESTDERTQIDSELLEKQKRDRIEIEQLKGSLQVEKELEIEEVKRQIASEIEEAKEKQQHDLRLRIDELKIETEVEYKNALEIEREQFERKLNDRKVELEKSFNESLERIELVFKEKEKEIENNFQMNLKQTENDFLLKLDERVKEINLAHKTVLDRMKDDHELTLEELLRDFRSEEEIIRKEHHQHLSDMRDKLNEELEAERQRMRELGSDRLYEKVRCEKRLLEDKYKCLKDKYIRLKTDVKISLEKKNRRRKEQSLTTTTGSDTERSTSHKKANHSDQIHLNSEINKRNVDHHHHHHHHQQSKLNRNPRPATMKPDNKVIQQIIIEDLDTSLSEPSKNDNDSSGRENVTGARNTSRSRRKLFTRLKSNSLSRLNNNNNNNNGTSVTNGGMSIKVNDPNLNPKRSCSPVENLRRQLEKLEDLEDQFPQPPSDTYHLRYPFTDAGDPAGSSELEFFRHRIHLERDSVRRAKDTLRSQRTNFQKRQRDLKLKHGSAARNAIQQLYSEERDLTDMEVSLHRTRSLLGEKVIRLRHLEQSLQRISALNNKQEDQTLSDLSSHSASSGISSTEFATATDIGRTVQFQESSEIMHSLETLNSEIREIWDVLNKQQQQQVPVPLVWPVNTTAIPTLNAIPTLADRLHEYEYRQRAAFATHGVQSIVVTQQAPGGAAQGGAITTTLVERTKNLRDWLRQAKTEQGDNFNVGGQATL